ncbi:MAG: NmrA family NAD(P)-binding protein, partial [Chloroflexi bacterium]|nr:NmrA family NAD(P)-binding protein [Chloroflexota bacterium]
MIQERRRHRVLVTGATGFLGYRVVIALLEIDAQVAVLVRPDRQESLMPLRDRIQILHGDVWNRASLKGRA